MDMISVDSASKPDTEFVTVWQRGKIVGMFEGKDARELATDFMEQLRQREDRTK